MQMRQLHLREDTPVVLGLLHLATGLAFRWVDTKGWTLALIIASLSFLMSTLTSWEWLAPLAVYFGLKFVLISTSRLIEVIYLDQNRGFMRGFMDE